jgi:hypothetical protein
VRNGARKRRTDREADELQCFPEFLRIPPSLAMVFRDELVKTLAREGGCGIAWQRRVEEAVGQRILGRRPPGQHIDLPLRRDNALYGVAQLVGGHAPTTSFQRLDAESLPANTTA